MTPTPLDAAAYYEGMMARYAAEHGDCIGCLEAPAVEDDLCRECWDEINGQFGVGA